MGTVCQLTCRSGEPIVSKKFKHIISMVSYLWNHNYYVLAQKLRRRLQQLQGSL